MIIESASMTGTALFNDDRTHRFLLTRTIDADNPRVVQFIGLNPSIADEAIDDPTIRRIIGFARSWSFGTLVMTNIFSLRSTDPKGLYASDEPDRPENSRHIIAVASAADLIVCAWGVHGAYAPGFLTEPRGDVVADGLRDNGAILHCLGRTKGGHPRHPLYLRADTELEIYA